MAKNSKLGLAVAALAAFSMWFYVQKVLIPYQQADAALHEQPRGILSDLYPRWVGARELLLHGRNPYSSDVTREIQRGYYGRELDLQRPQDPRDEERFAYPVYVVLLLAPTVTLPFSVVRMGFNVLLISLTAASVFWWMHALRWRPSCSVIAIFVILTMGSFPVAQGLKLQQLSLLVAALLSASAAAIASGYLAMGGILLALATIKPQLAWLPVLWMLLWTIRDVNHRKRTAIVFAITMLILLAISQWLLPSWIGDFLQGLRAYHRYTANVSVLGLLVGPVVGHLLEGLCIAFTLWCLWPLLAPTSKPSLFGVGFANVACLSVLVAPMFAPYNQALLLPAIMVLARQLRNVWYGKRLHRYFLVLAAAALSWQWIAAFGLMIFYIARPSASDWEWKLPLYSMIEIPLLVYGVLASWTWKAEISADTQS